MADTAYNVLFLCTANSARSILAEAILRRAGAGQFNAYSAGSHPCGEVNPNALALLRELGHPVDALRSKGWDEFTQPDRPALDFIFTVCDNAAQESCPVWPGHPASAHWGIPDPAVVEGSAAEKRRAFAEAYRLLETRIDAFLSLPIAALDHASLKKRLNAIGKL